MAAPASPEIWVLSTGTEILQGKYPDRNAQWIGRQMLELGYPVTRIMAAPDRPEALRAVMGQAAREADLVITTGGLGPTTDDMNRQILAGLWGRELYEDEASLAKMRDRFERRGRVMPDSNRIQALIPAGAHVLANDWGTAAGFMIEPNEDGPRAILIALPGPPREMQPMFEQCACPLLLARWGRAALVRRTLTLHTIGISESRVQELVGDCFDADPRVNFALLAGDWKVDVRLTLSGEDDATLDALAHAWRKRVYQHLGSEVIYGEDSETLESVVGVLLSERHQTLTTAESCTAGLLAGRLTAVPGSSAYFREGFITYANAAKQARLGVSAQLLEEHGAVSEPVAEAMARGASEQSGADWALSITGIAGPEGGSDEKPVGLVYIGICKPDGSVEVVRHQFLGAREEVRAQAVQQALALLLRALKQA